MAPAGSTQERNCTDYSVQCIQEQEILMTVWMFAFIFLMIAFMCCLSHVKALWKNLTKHTRWMACCTSRQEALVNRQKEVHCKAQKPGARGSATALGSLETDLSQNTPDGSTEQEITETPNVQGTRPDTFTKSLKNESKHKLIPTQNNPPPENSVDNSLYETLTPSNLIVNDPAATPSVPQQNLNKNQHEAKPGIYTEFVVYV